MKKCMFMLFLAALILPLFAQANVRLPVRYALPPAAVPFLPPQPAPEVRHESLAFDCDEVSCLVSAEYQIRVDAPLALPLSFIGPNQEVGEVRVNGSAVAVAPREVFRYRSTAKTDGRYTIDIAGREQAFDKDARDLPCRYPFADGKVDWASYVACLVRDNSLEANSYFPVANPWQLYDFVFNAPLRSGDNTIKVVYRQPMSKTEGMIAYFHEIKIFSFVSYELWPLKEWRLASDFALDIEVRYRNPRYGFLWLNRNKLWVEGGMLDSEYAPFSPYGMGFTDLAPGLAAEQRDQFLLYRTRLGSKFPDRLKITIGN